MKDNVKFYGLLAVVVLAVFIPSVILLGGYGVLLDCVLLGAISALSK